MSDTSPILALPLIQPAQAQKHVTHNEALRLLDVLVQAAVSTRGANTPPATPAAGERHIVGSAPTGLWAGQAGRIALWEDPSGWAFLTPLEGWTAHVVAEDAAAVFIDGAWVGAAERSLRVLMLGVGTDADVTSRLAVASPASVFSHAGASHRMTLNKAATGDTASLSFQNGFSGRAEMGLVGDDTFRLQVSPDGAAFLTAVEAAPATGILRLPQGVRSDGFALRDAADPTKAAQFTLSGLTTGVTRSYTLPDVTGTLAHTTNGAQTFAGAITVSAATATLGTSTATSTYGVGTGSTASGNTKTVNLGTGGASGSTTVVNVGPATAGAGGSLVINTPTVTFAATVGAVGMAQANLTALYAGLGGATADATNRLSVNTPAVLFNHAGAGTETTLNKAAAGDDAALAFKTGFSARALAGLLGSDDFTLKVSADGSAFAEALVADRASGRVRFATGIALDAQAADPAGPANGWVWLHGPSGKLRARIGGQTRSLGDSEVPWLTPPVGEYVQTCAGIGGGATATLAGAADRMDIFPFIPRADITVDRLALNCTAAVAGALAKIVVFAADANGRPDALVTETGTLDCGTTGNKLATVSMSFMRGTTYWVGVRHSATATLSVWASTATPDINGGNPVTTARKTLRRTLAFATPAPATGGFLSSEITTASAPAIWLRVA
jgi:hypothetical protein